ncbi:hypothetical protein ACOACO_07375 [Nocardioides sp. CPCC 205120]|uniref:hypothetical protein n=1 Tax=Nocardioides sp. CPCC 205120 TaxID=3406462 RepID=UPI003B5075EB
MSTPLDDQLDDRLGAALRERADDVGGTTLALAAVRGRARRIRTRRLAATGAGLAAVVLAVAVPVGLTGGGADDRSTPPVASGTGTTATDAVVRGATVELDLRDLSRGADPAVPYSLDGDLHLPSGHVADGGSPAGADPYAQVVPIDDGFLARSGTDLGVIHLGPEGGLREHVHRAESLVDDPASGRVALVEADSLVVVGGHGDQFWTRRLLADASAPGLYLSQARPLAFADDDVLVALDDEPGPRVVRVPRDGEIEVVVDQQGTAAAPDGSALVVPTPEGCTAVLSPDDGRELWRTCEQRVSGFSPDGRLAVVAPADAMGGDPVDGVVDARTGEPVVTLRAGTDAHQVALSGSAWESPTSLLVTVRQSDTEASAAEYAVVRVDLTTGRAELAVPAVSYDERFDVDQRFVLY